MNGNRKDSYDNEERSPWISSKSLKYGSMATGFTIIFIVLVLLVNILVSALDTKVPLSLDLTKNQTYNISSKTVSFIKGIKEPVKIIVLADRQAYLSNTVYAPAVKIMEQFQVHSSNISIDYINVDKNPTYASTNFPGASINAYDVVVKSGSKYKVIASSDLIKTSTDETTGSQSLAGYTAEQQLDTAILYCTTTNLPTIDVTTGHSEQDSTSLQGLLTKNNYLFETKNIASQGLNQEADMVVIASPQTDFTSDEISKLDAFLKNGGKYGKNLAVFMEPTQPSLPNLENYLKEWGIGAGTGVVYDTQNSVSNPFWILSGTTDSTVTGNLSSNSYGIFTVARPLNLLFSTENGYTTSAVVQTQSTSKLWNPSVVSNETAATFEPSDSDKAGPFVVMAKSTYNGVYDNGSVSSNVMVSGSLSAFNTDTIFQEKSFTNSSILINSINNVIGFKSPIVVEDKLPTGTTLSVTASQSQNIAIMYTVVIPLLIILVGLFVWLRRRHL